MKVTIRDVAQAAGVAPATVSNYLNDSAPVSEAARKKIGDAITRLNYRQTVRSVVPSRNATEIALFVPEAFENKDRMYLDETFLDLLRGVGEQLRQSGSRLTLLWHKQLPDIEREIIGSGAIGGVIYPSPHVDDPIPGLLLDNDVPLVTLGELSNRTDYHSVDMDNIAGAQMATRHLIELGHRDIAFIAPCPLDTMLSFYRLTGYQRAMTLSGLPLRSEYVRVGDFSAETGYRIAAELLALPHPPTAIVAGRDMLALGAIAAARQAGLETPGQLAVTGFDNTSLAEHHGITSVKAPLYDIGAEATRLLLEIVADKRLPARKLVIPTQLIVRASSDPASSDAGLRFY